MKLYCLSGSPERPCFVLRFKHMTVMLDCGLDIQNMLHFLPLSLTTSGMFSGLAGWSPPGLEGRSPPRLPNDVTLKDELRDVSGRIYVDSQPEFGVPELSMLDMSEVDAILVSNHHCMLALPYITQHTAFRGQIYATEPTLHIARLFMEELVEFIQRAPKPHRASTWKDDVILRHLPAPLAECVRPRSWRQIYTKQDVQACCSRVKTVSLRERVSLFGAIDITAFSSGYALGSCNWVLQTHYEKIAYVSSSSTLTTHPKPLEPSPLKHADILILTRLTQTPAANPDAMIGEFCINSAQTLRNGGNVLVPCYPSGVTYDLFECLSKHLESCNLLAVPLYFVSPVADSSLAYSNIYAEWLSSEKASKVYLPEPPFPHAELVKNQRLIHVPDLHSLKSELKVPCVVFTGHPSLRAGDVVHLLELWGGGASNTLIITEPDFPSMDALAPFQPLQMKVYHCPIDTSLSFNQANKLIRELKPAHLITSGQYVDGGDGEGPGNPAHHLDLDDTPTTYTRAEVLTLPVTRQYEQVELDPLLAAVLAPAEVKPGVCVATLTGRLVGRDNSYLIEPMSDDPSAPESASEPGCRRIVPPTAYRWGALDVAEFLAQLNKAGMADVKCDEKGEGSVIIHLPKEECLIQVDPTSTHIICEGNEQLRVRLKDLLLKCLAKF